MQNIIIFCALVLAMFACGYILQRPIAKGKEPSSKRVAGCLLSAALITVIVSPTILPPLMAGWFIVVGTGASMVGVFGPTTFKAIRYAFEGAYGIKKSDQ